MGTSQRPCFNCGGDILPHQAEHAVPARDWFMVCRSNCELNAVRHASVELEEEAAATMWWDFQAVKRAVEEPREAWIKYYAYW